MNTMDSHNKSNDRSTSDSMVDGDHRLGVIAIAQAIVEGTNVAGIVNQHDSAEQPVSIDQTYLTVGQECIDNFNSVLRSVNAKTPDEAVEGDEYIVSQPMSTALAIMHATTAFVFYNRSQELSNQSKLYARLLAVSVCANICMSVASWLS